MWVYDGTDFDCGWGDTVQLRDGYDVQSKPPVDVLLSGCESASIVWIVRSRTSSTVFNTKTILCQSMPFSLDRVSLFQSNVILTFAG